MKTKINPAVVGAFVLGAFAIGIIAPPSRLGSFSLLLQKPERFMAYFDESISGLDEGSPVKLRGVRVGHVVGISIRYDRATNKSVAAVLCELNRGSITDEHGASLDISDREALQALVDHGLRAQLEVLGLATGLLFVELDFQDPTKHPDTSNTTEVKYVVVPSAPSDLAEFRASATTLLAKMQEIDFKGLSTELKNLLVETRLRLEGVDFKGLAAQWKKTGESVDALARSPDALRSFENLNKTLEVLRSSIVRLDTQVEANGKDLQATHHAQGQGGPRRSFQRRGGLGQGVHQRPAGLLLAARTRAVPWSAWPTPPSRSSGSPTSLSATRMRSSPDGRNPNDKHQREDHPAASRPGRPRRLGRPRPPCGVQCRATRPG